MRRHSRRRRRCCRDGRARQHVRSALPYTCCYAYACTTNEHMHGHAFKLVEFLPSFRFTVLLIGFVLPLHGQSSSSSSSWSSASFSIQITCMCLQQQTRRDASIRPSQVISCDDPIPDRPIRTMSSDGPTPSPPSSHAASRRLSTTHSFGSHGKLLPSPGHGATASQIAASRRHEVLRRLLRLQREHLGVLLAERREAAAVADRRPGGHRGDLDHAARRGAPAATAAAAAAAADARGHGDVQLRGAGGGDGRVLGGEPAGAGRVRVRAPRRAPGARRPREGGGGEAAQGRERAGRARVPGGGGHHQPRAAPPPGGARRLLHRRRAPPARLRVRAQPDPRASPPRERAAGDGLGDAAAHRARRRQGARLPARGMRPTDHPPRHQVGQHPAGQRLRGHGRRLRAGQAHEREPHARVHPRHGHLRLPGAGVRVQRQAHGEVGRLLVRRHAVGAAHRPPTRRPLLLRPGRPRRLGEAGPAARPGRRQLRRAGRPQAAGRLRPDGGGARRGQRRGLRPPRGAPPPQDEPDRPGAAGGHAAGGPQRRGATGPRRIVRPRLRLALRLRRRRVRVVVHGADGADQAGRAAQPGLQHRLPRIHPGVRPPVAREQRQLSRAG
uniref:Uncharacterized protein n=1 Tax=Zea mays TaxID=4577 RepID=A0A804MWW2_MAIZE